MKLDTYVDLIKAGGPGSGCQGRNCGRPAGHSGEHGPKTHEDVLQEKGFKHHETVAGIKIYKKGKAEVSVHHNVFTLRDTKLGVKKGTTTEALEEHLGHVAAGGPGSGCHGENCGRPRGHEGDHGPQTKQDRRDAMSMKHEFLSRLSGFKQDLEQAARDDGFTTADVLINKIDKLHSEYETHANPDVNVMKDEMGKLMNEADDLLDDENPPRTTERALRNMVSRLSEWG